MVVFMFPETKWHRPHPVEFDAVAQDPAASPKEGSVEKASVDAVEYAEPTGVHVNALSHIETAARDPHLGKGYPSKQQWAIFQPNANVIKSLLADLWLPWKMFAFPIVEFAAFVASWSCSSFLTLNLIQTQVFAAPPYNFTSETIGFFNFALLIGAFIGLGTSGKLSDWVAARATEKNGGIREVRSVTSL